MENSGDDTSSESESDTDTSSDSDSEEEYGDFYHSGAARAAGAEVKDPQLAAAVAPNPSTPAPKGVAADNPIAPRKNDKDEQKNERESKEETSNDDLPDFGDASAIQAPAAQPDTPNTEDELARGDESEFDLTSSDEEEEAIAAAGAAAGGEQPPDEDAARRAYLEEVMEDGAEKPPR